MKRKKIFTALLVLAFLLASAVPAFAAIPEVSESYYVADYADVITDETETYIVEKNAELEQYCSGAQIVIVTVDFLDGMDIEDYCYKLFNDWQIGAKGENNGVLLLLTIGEENYWCMTGKGLEKALTAGTIDDILWYNLEDYFAAGDYDSGVKVTFDKLAEEIYDFYGVTGIESSDSEIYYDPYEEVELSAMDWIIALVVMAIPVIILITVICVIIGFIKSRRRRRTYYNPNVPPRPVVINPRPARKVYIPTVVHKPAQHTRPASRPVIFGGGIGSSPSRSSRPASRPSTSKSFTSPGRSSFGSQRSSSSFGGGSRSRGIGGGGGGMSRGGGAGRRGR